MFWKCFHAAGDNSINSSSNTHSEVPQHQNRRLEFTNSNIHTFKSFGAHLTTHTIVLRRERSTHLIRRLSRAALLTTTLSGRGACYI